MADRIPDVSARIAEPAEGVAAHEELGRVVVVRVRYGPTRRALARLVRLPTTFTVRLDELGSAAWRLLDGRRTVAEVRSALEQQFPCQDGLGARLGKFLGLMVSRDLVRLR